MSRDARRASARPSRTPPLAPSLAILRLATPRDAGAIAELRNAASRKLTQEFGKGPWASHGTERGVLLDMRRGTVWIATEGQRAIATLTLMRRKPWAIDPRYFGACATPLYLTSMAITPELQRAGLGRRCMEDVRAIVRAWPADALRLDAYDATAGAGEFYRKCGLTEVGRASYRGAPLVYFEWVI